MIVHCTADAAALALSHILPGERHDLNESIPDRHEPEIARDLIMIVDCLIVPGSSRDLEFDRLAFRNLEEMVPPRIAFPQFHFSRIPVSQRRCVPRNVDA